MPALLLNATATAEWVVRASDLASSLPSDPRDAFPPVFATPRLAALMELACARLLQPILEPGELSVGVSLDLAHTAATLEGAKVTATARYVGRDGAFYVLKVTASDPAGEIGRATHKRAIVSVERLLAGAQKRAAAPRPL
ncbi:MAG: thioesterase [Verrucomicrobiota bacterium]